ncbi:MAG: type IV pilus modification PilV family protein [Candidatus Omnitrophota bacterium]
MAKSTHSGFTLVELMVATLILAIVLVGLLASYIACLQLTDLARNTSVAINLAQTKMEEIKNAAYTSIKNDYDPAGVGVPFTIIGVNGMGVTYVDNTDPDLLLVKVTVCWRERGGRIIGEDTDLNGVLNSGEDKPPLNNQLDSIAQVITYIARH